MGRATPVQRFLTGTRRAVHSVTLTVTSDKGLGSTTTRSLQVDPGAPPKADFVFSPTAPGVGQTVQFNAAQSAGNAGHTISSYAWDFGDGGKASGLTATHAFANAAGYNVVLTVTDDVGQTAAATKTVAVTAAQGPGAPTADWAFSPTDPSVGQSVLFNATRSKAAAGHSIVSYAWNFGDGATGSNVTTNHSSAVTDTFNRTAVLTQSVVVP